MLVIPRLRVYKNGDYQAIIRSSDAGHSLEAEQNECINLAVDVPNKNSNDGLKDNNRPCIYQKIKKETKMESCAYTTIYDEDKDRVCSPIYSLVHFHMNGR